MSTFYKVVNHFEGSLRSTNITGIAGRNNYLAQLGRNLEYVEGKVTYPKVPNSKLFVFGNLEAALDFVGGLPHLQIWEAEVTNPEHAPFYDFAINPYSNSIESFWDAKAKNEPLEQFGEGIDNSFFVDSVKLVKRVK